MENILARLLFVMMSVFVAAGMVRSSFCDLAVECFALDMLEISRNDISDVGCMYQVWCCQIGLIGCFSF